MKNLNKLIAAITISVIVSACSATKPEITIKPYEPGSCEVHGKSEPDWLCAPDDMFPGDDVYKRGIANASIKDLQTQITVAVENAKANLVADVVSKAAKSFKQKVTSSGLIESQQQDVEITIQVVTDSELTLPPVTQVNQKHTKSGDLYVLIKLDKNELNKKIKEKENMMMREFNARLKRQESQKSVAGSQS